MSDQLLRLEYRDPNQLTGNPKNWRVHPEDQRATFAALLKQVGWADVIRYNEETERIVDGHMRVDQAIRLGLPVVPVVIGRWTEAQEAVILATADTLGLMATTDKVAWTELMRSCDTDSEEIADLFTGLSENYGIIPGDLDGSDEAEAGDQVEEIEEAEEPDTVAPDLVWPSDDDLEIPRLDPKMQADGAQFPVTVWRTVGRRAPMKGTWCFYQDDLKFEPLWRDPGAILLSGAPYAIEPNFSTHPQMARAKIIWDVYRKRWLNRFWQSRGVRTFVDVSVHEKFRADNFRGVPKGWKAFATRVQRDSRDVQADWLAAAEYSGREDLTFLVYGGGPSIKSLCVEQGWQWVEDQCHRERQAAAQRRKGS